MKQFERKVLAFIEKEELVTSGQRILIACSGGVDSVALLLFMANHQQQLGIEVGAVHVDHMLRGEESKEDGKFVKELCEQLKVPFYGGSVPVPEIAEREGGNLQMICREGRYEFFKRILKSHRYDALATAHHAEDQLETVLMQISKGSLPEGMLPVRKMEQGILIRPFLLAKKGELYAYTVQKGAIFREDPSNESDAYLRNRIRHHIVPLLLSENPAAALNSVKMTKKLQQDDDLLMQLSLKQFQSVVSISEKGFPTVQQHRFAAMHPALQTRLIPLLLKYLYNGESIPVEFTHDLLEQLQYHMQSAEGNVSIDLPRGLRFVREYGRISIVKDEKVNCEDVILLPKGIWTRWADVLFYWNTIEADGVGHADAASEHRFFNLSESELPLYVRGKRDGDRILLPGMTKPKRLSRLFIDEKIGALQREKQPVLLTAQHEICAVPGIRYGTRFTHQWTGWEKYIFKMKEASSPNLGREEFRC